MSKYLIVVDMQRDFIDGVLGTPEAQAIVPKVKAKIAEYRNNGDEIIFTRDTHQNDYLDTNEGKHLPVKHCVIGTDGWGILDELSQESDIICDKPTFGCLNWKRYIDDADDLEIEIVGVCTDICVVSNALILKAMFPEAVVKVDSKACAGVAPSSHEAALITMKMCQVEVE